MNVPHPGSGSFGEDTQMIKVPCILGDCTIQLSHATTYEPPLYLFSELLEKVPQGTPPLRVWDAVADVVDVQNSFWQIADMQAFSAATSSSPFSSSLGEEERGSGKGGERANSARSVIAPTLASLVASNRLLQAGLTPSALLKGNFSAARMLEELVRLQSRMGLEGEEGAVLMTNHFVNLLAWRKLCEVNHSAVIETGKGEMLNEKKKVNEEEEEEEEGNPRRRARVEEIEREDILDRLRPCVDPWSAEIDDPANAGVFISGREENVERKVELLETLSRLYERPWRRLRSRGCQTEYVVPPGTMNITSPYANGQPFRERRRAEGGDTTTTTTTTTTHINNNNNILNIVEDLVSRSERPRQLSDGYAVFIRSTTLPEVGKRRVDLNCGAFNRAESTILFGHSPGVQYGIAGDPIYVDVGLATFTSNPQTLSTLHFALVLRCKSVDEVEERDPRARLSSSSAITPSNKSASNHHHSDGESERALEEKREERIDPGKSLGCTVWIMNYGRNEIAVIRSTEESSSENPKDSFTRRVHVRDALQLQVGDEIVLGDGEIRVSLITMQEESNTLDGEVPRIKNEEGEGEGGLLLAVKKETSLEVENAV